MSEGMLRDYLKRTDLWSLYLDQVNPLRCSTFNRTVCGLFAKFCVKLKQEIRLGDVDLIHALFERAISLSLPPKR